MLRANMQENYFKRGSEEVMLKPKPRQEEGGFGFLDFTIP